MATTTKSTAKTEVLTLDDLADLIDDQARKHLHMSGLEFVDNYMDPWSLETFTATYLRMMARLAEGKRRQSLVQRLRRRAQRDAQQDNHHEPSHPEGVRQE
jgi:hypothetical protein